MKKLNNFDLSVFLESVEILPLEKLPRGYQRMAYEIDNREKLHSGRYEILIIDQLNLLNRR